MTSHKREKKDGVVTMTNGTDPWSSLNRYS